MAPPPTPQQVEALSSVLREHAAQCRDWADRMEAAASALDTQREVMRTGDLKADVVRALKVLAEGQETLKRFG